MMPKRQAKPKTPKVKAWTKREARIEWLDPDTVGVKPVKLKPGEVAIMRGPVVIGIQHAKGK